MCVFLLNVDQICWTCRRMAAAALVDTDLYETS